MKAKIKADGVELDLSFDEYAKLYVGLYRGSRYSLSAKQILDKLPRVKGPDQKDTTNEDDNISNIY